MDEDLGGWVANYLRELYFVQLDYRNIECSLLLKKNTEIHTLVKEAKI